MRGALCVVRGALCVVHDGRQFVSWIHGDDFTRAVRWLIDREISGVVNLAAPNPLPNAEFMRALRAAWGARVGLPSPAWMLELGAWAIRTESELVLKSRRVVPAASSTPDSPSSGRTGVQRRGISYGSGKRMH